MDRAIANGGISLDDFLARELTDPCVAEAVKQVRMETGRAKQQASIAKLRLTAGLTQAELAALMNTQQSAIARLEKNPATLSYSGMVSMAKAIGCELSELFAAIHQQCIGPSAASNARQAGR